MLKACGISLDYSHQKIADHSFSLLFDLAEKSNIKEKIHALMRGDCVNFSEKKPALHTALRSSSEIPLLINNKMIST